MGDCRSVPDKCRPEMAWDLRPFAIGRKGDGLWLAGPGGRVGTVATANGLRA